MIEMEEGVGFEPTVPVTHRQHWFSRPTP